MKEPKLGSFFVVESSVADGNTIKYYNAHLLLKEQELHSILLG